MNERQTDENPYELNKVRDLINRVQQSIIDIETQTNTIEEADPNQNELEKIRDLINRVQQSIVEVETQTTKIEWLRLYFAMYFLNKSKSVDSSSKDLTEGIASDFQRNQPINVYGVIEGKYQYINTCEVYQLEAVLKCLKADWWESFAIELINKPGQMIPVAEVIALSL
jgi:wobble nucleotide-excising tRNase